MLTAWMSVHVVQTPGGVPCARPVQFVIRSADPPSKTLPAIVTLSMAKGPS